MDEENQKLMEALETIRRDKHQPWRYVLFTFVNGMAQGLGFMLGATLVLGIVIYTLTLVLSKMINFPVIGYYFGEVSKLVDLYIQQAPKIR